MKLNRILSLPLLPFKTYYYWRKANNSILPGKKFAEYGIKLGLKLLLKGKLSPKLLLNPVSIVRYFEYDFADKCFNSVQGENILDVSSPYLFGFYISAKNTCRYNYINPDKTDLDHVTAISKKINFRGNYSTGCVDAIKLMYPDNSFDKIVSISVIEHITNDGDSEVMKQLWRVLKPGGLLVLTFPVKKQYDEEFTSDRIYNIEQEENDGHFFFQRYYNKEKIGQRLLSSIHDFEIIDKKVFGEKTAGFYDEYKKRWQNSGYSETVKDPFYISKYFEYYPDIDSLPGLGVMGLTIKKSV